MWRTLAAIVGRECARHSESLAVVDTPVDHLEAERFVGALGIQMVDPGV
jgi:hypothetical protein